MSLAGKIELVIAPVELHVAVQRVQLSEYRNMEHLLKLLDLHYKTDQTAQTDRTDQIIPCSEFIKRIAFSAH